VLLNNDDGNVNLTLLGLAPMKSNAKQPLYFFLISLTRTLSEDGSLALEINLCSLDHIGSANPKCEKLLKKKLNDK
jgi:hypothetical protein